MSDDPKILGFPKAEVPLEERAGRLKTEVDELARKPETEWPYYLERGDIAKKHGIETAALKKMIEATIKANEKKAREDKAEDRQRVRHDERGKNQSASASESASRRADASRSGPIKRLRVSKKKKLALSQRLSSCRRASAKPSSGNWPRNWTRTSSCCAMNSSY